ncbi:PH domain-containing protein [Cellulosilyticum ruminicola]|uniref:PH domain-containing protein n=1 Tax=Cellulosilyticum ruminicola TaxID=425254 RepID=UPI0006D1351B|nr:PH domain-containing protein [Cellulosilyticum ruminicola]
MIDFINPEYIKLSMMNSNEAEEVIKPILVPNEKIEVAFRTVRDKVIFTSKRIITVNIQGVSGKRKDYTTIPYGRIQAFSVQTSGTFDLESELNIWISSVGKLHFEISGRYDVQNINRLLSEYVL